MSQRNVFRAAIAVAALSTVTAAASATPSAVYTMAPVRIGKVEARAREALVESAAYIDAQPRDGVIRVQLERFDPAVRDVQVEGLGHPVTVGDSTVLVIPVGEGKARVRRTLNYTVRYSDMVLPGFRPAPLRISVLP